MKVKCKACLYTARARDLKTEQQRITVYIKLTKVHYYLDDQVNIWRRVGDGKDARSGQGGIIRMWSVRFQEAFKLFRV